MIDLLKDKNELIQVSSSDLKIIFDIDASTNLKLKLDWNEIKKYQVEINISGSENVLVLETGLKNDNSVVYNLNEDAKLNLCIASFENGTKSSYQVNLAKNAFFKGAYADFSYGEKDFTLDCILKGEGAYSTWNLASLTTNEDKKRFTISFFHKARETFARMENYGVCENKSKLEFLGTSHIEKGAKRTSTHQAAKIMVFDKECKAAASPILKIDENDVQASHASIVGQINEDHIFYLMSRGLKEEEAKKIITLGYLNPILDFFEDDDILELIKTNIEKRV